MIGSAYVVISCDQEYCDYSEEIKLEATARGGWDERYVEGELKRLGWRSVSENKHICPECGAEEKE